MAELRYNFENIRALLTKAFNDKELRALVFDVPDLRAVYDELAENTGKAEIISKLLEYAERQMQIQALLTLAKKRNRGRYEKEGPYYQGDPTEALQEKDSLRRFDLSEADLRQINLHKAKLRLAQLAGANLSGLI
jgi:uncharacterized protein YjbI with pentapeptide repeats